MVNERNLLIWLNHLGGISYQMVLDLIDYFGNLMEIWDADAGHLYKVLTNHRIIVEKMLKTRGKQDLKNIMDYNSGQDFHIRTILDEDYPNKLKNIYNPPYVLFLKGITKLEKPLVSIVGARKSTAYGRWAAKMFAKQLVEWDVGIISGLAMGIDAEAHKGAIDAHGYTVAVLGCGINICYPKSNHQLYKEVEKAGCIISEYGPNIKPLKHNFPARNRIISGLSDAVIVVEAGEQSGTLITVGHALDQGKDVFALPGNINNYQSKGTNKLIKEGANILLDIEDVIEELKYKYSLENKKAKVEIKESLSREEMKIYDIIKKESLHIDLISYKSGINISNLNRILTILELKGFIQQTKGKIFTACN